MRGRGGAPIRTVTVRCRIRRPTEAQRMLLGRVVSSTRRELVVGLEELDDLGVDNKGNVLGAAEDKEDFVNKHACDDPLWINHFPQVYYDRASKEPLDKILGRVFKDCVFVIKHLTTPGRPPASIPKARR